MECVVPVKTDVLVLEASTLPRSFLNAESWANGIWICCPYVPRSMFGYTHWKEVEFHSGRDLSQLMRIEACHIPRKLSGC